MSRPFEDPAVRLERHVDRSGGPNACHPWTKSTTVDGYGHLRVNGRSVRAHRLAYELVHGVIAEWDMCVCHSCDNRRCCNVAHLWLGTNAENVADRERKGRRVAPRGEASGKAKLTASLARAFRDEHEAGATCVALAAKYSVKKCTVEDVCRGRTWLHVGGYIMSANEALRGQRNASAKLTDEQVLEMRLRKAAGESAVLLAAEFGIHRNSVYAICSGTRRCAA